MRSASALALVCGCAMPGCELKPWEPNATASADRGPPVGARIVISEREMFAKPNPNSRKINMAEPGTRVVEVVAILDDFLEVRTIDPDLDIELRFFVPPEGVLDRLPPRAKAAEPVAIGGDDEPLWSSLLECEPGWKAEAGTPLTWRDGGEAGVVLAAHEFPLDSEVHGDRVCFAASNLDVCIASAKLEHFSEADCKPDPAPTSGSGPKLTVRQTKASVSEGLDRDIVRRLVRGNIRGVIACYQAALTENPTLAGRVEIAFEIASNGRVSSSKVHASTLEPDVDILPQCIAEAATRWRFPEPQAGATVSVVQPFELSPG